MQHERRIAELARGLLVVALGLAVGCADEASGPTAADFEQAQKDAIRNVEIAKQSRAKREELKKERAKPKPNQPVDPSLIGSGVLIETGYSYDPTGKRDPFRNFMWNRPDRMAQFDVAGPLEQFDLAQLEVVAVVWRTGNARALIEDPSGESYIVGEGAAIGKNQGRVIAIDDNTVVVKETYVDYLGQETTKDIEMRIRRSEGG